MHSGHFIRIGIDMIAESHMNYGRIYTNNNAYQNVSSTCRENTSIHMDSNTPPQKSHDCDSCKLNQRHTP